MPRSVAEHVADPRHAGALAGATSVGEARGGDRLVVRIGVWLDPRGAVARARFLASTCASLIAYAEAACTLLEEGTPPASIDPECVRASIAGVHPVHHGRADLVALAVARASGSTPRQGATP